MCSMWSQHLDLARREAGDAFYMTPGHTPAAVAGTEFTMFSPAEQLKATEAAIAKGMEAQGAQNAPH